jgi:hypothetical protein
MSETNIDTKKFTSTDGIARISASLRFCDAENLQFFLTMM